MYVVVDSLLSTSWLLILGGAEPWTTSPIHSDTKSHIPRRWRTQTTHYPPDLPDSPDSLDRILSYDPYIYDNFRAREADSVISGELNFRRRWRKFWGIYSARNFRSKFFSFVSEGERRKVTYFIQSNKQEMLSLTQLIHYTQKKVF